MTLETQTEVLAVLAAVIGLLGAATLAEAVARRKAGKPAAELAARLRTWWWIFLPLGVCLAGGKFTGTLFFALVSALALREYLTLIPARSSDLSVRLWAYAAVPIQYWFAATGYYGMFIVFVPVYMFVLLPIRAILAGNTAGFITAMATLQWGLMATVFSVSHAALLLGFTVSSAPRVAPHWPGESTAPPGVALALLLLVLTEGNDVAQYVWGKSLGRRKVIPAVSPGKTWAGLIGGVATTALAAGVIGPWLTILDRPHALVLGAVVGVGGFFGDLTMSALKRDLGVKDSGTILPGHGGVLDRIDSLTFTAPLFFHAVYFWY